MSKRQKHLYEFGHFALDVRNRELLREGEPVPLHPKVFDTLLLLVERRGEVLEKEELMKELWPDSFVEESNLSQNIYVLRKALGQKESDQTFIKTLPKRGYRFVGEVREVNEDVGLILEEQITSHITINEEVDGDGGSAWDANAPRRVDQIGTESISAAKRAAIKAAGVAIALAILLAGGSLAYQFLARSQFANSSARQTTTAEPFQKMKITRLTDIGKAHSPAISPDGKYLAYIMREDPGGQSIWVKHLPTGSSAQIVPPVAGVQIDTLAFSRDASFVYYGRNEKSFTHLYQVPLLGGSPRKLIENIWGRVGLSPDGAQLAFLRTNWNQGEHMVVAAGVDGTGERVLTKRKSPDYFNVFGVGPEWSPDGKVIALGGGRSGSDGYDGVIEVRVEDGSQHLISDRKWRSVGQVAWLSDGSCMLMAARDQQDPTQQIWLVSYPEGLARRITNDLNYYERLGLTADSSLLVAEQSEHVSNIWVSQDTREARTRLTAVGNSAEVSPVTQITTGKSGRDGFNGIGWTPDSKVIYSSRAGGNYDLWITEPDGSGRKQLTFDGAGCAFPAVSPDGRFVVYSSERAGRRNIWRSDIDGRNLMRLTAGSNELHPSFSPDGRWVVYESGEGATHLWKVSIDGGPPALLFDKYSSGSPVVSPDGQLIAFGYYDEKAESPWRLGVIPSSGGEIIKSFPQPFRSFQWTPDGHSLIYISGTSTVSNIWSQPLDGSEPMQLTNFKEKRIYWFDRSRDGKRLALARGESTYDAVLISDFR